jgi:hypothetical protein
MPGFRYLIKNIHVLNIALIIAIYFMAQYSFYPVAGSSDKATILPDKKLLPEEEVKPENYNSPSVSEFTMIAEQNLFHPERKILAEKISAPPVPPPEILLYGTLITDRESIAYLEDKKLPYTTPGRGKRQLAFRIGNTIGGFTLKSIEAEKIELIKGEESMIVYLIDSVKPKTREAPAQTSSSSVSKERESKQSPATNPLQPAGTVTVKPDTSSLISKERELKQSQETNASQSAVAAPRKPPSWRR